MEGMSEDLPVRGAVVVPGRELRWRFSRSSGPGGQSVNTTDSRVELSLDVSTTDALGPLLRERALTALAEEVRIMLDEGVVAAPQDIDLCMLLGAGWPFHLGGITPYLDRTGVSERVTGQRFLPVGTASVPA